MTPNSTQQPTSRDQAAAKAMPLARGSRLMAKDVGPTLMSARDRYPALFQLFAGYLHEDWNLDDLLGFSPSAPTRSERTPKGPHAATTDPLGRRIA